MIQGTGKQSDSFGYRYLETMPVKKITVVGNVKPKREEVKRAEARLKPPLAKKHRKLIQSKFARIKRVLDLTNIIEGD